jgi:hypothetical protein
MAAQCNTDGYGTALRADLWLKVVSFRTMSPITGYLRILALAAPLSLAACGGDDDAPNPDGPPAGGPDASTIDGAAGAVPLITGTWTIPEGQEIYWCARVTVPETILVKEFHPIIPLGTHHTVLTVDNPGTPDGEYPCSVAENGNKRGVYGTGVGANPFILPAGIAEQIEAGEQLVLNLHLYNTGDTPLSGVSGVEVVLADPSEVVHVADSDLFGKIFGLVVAPGQTTQTANCTVSEAQTFFAVSPHMHKLGVHARAVAQTAGGPVTLVDLPYDFEDQLLYLLPSEVTLMPGDTITFDCSYDNTTGATVYFGDSSDDEMCFLGAYRYPANANGINCM